MLKQALGVLERALGILYQTILCSSARVNTMSNIVLVFEMHAILSNSRNEYDILDLLSYKEGFKGMRINMKNSTNIVILIER